MDCSITLALLLFLGLVPTSVAIGYVPSGKNTYFMESKLFSNVPTKHVVAFIPRGGAYDYDTDYDSDYDDYDPEELFEMEHRPTRRPSNRPPPNRRPTQSRPPNRSSRYPPRPQRRNGPPRKPKQSVANVALNQAKDLTQKSLSMATSATISTLKTSGKAAYYLTAPKFVTKREIVGVWRLDQSIGQAVCAANIEFTPQGDAITKYKGEEDSHGYLFQSRSWPRSCTIEFEAKAFQGPGDEVPVSYYYKGYFRRKIADKNVIKIVGKIYEIRRSKFGKGRANAGREVGSFVARRRLTASDRNRISDDRSTEGRSSDFDDAYDVESDFYDSDGYDDYDTDY